MTRTLVVGAGAAGLTAAIFARRAGEAVLVVEKTADGGRKILISGGGRCNVLPATIRPERFVTTSPAHLVRAWLRSWPIDAQRRFFEQDVGVPLALETGTGKFFPRSNRARDVRDGLVALARRAGAEFRFRTALTSLHPADAGWRAGLSTGGQVEADRVILATGGLSVPATGSDGEGLRAAGELGHRIADTYPALTPLLADPAVHASLAGVSLDVRVRARWRGRTSETRGGFLFTHRGYSGPAILDVSHVAVRSTHDSADRAVLRVDWCGVAADDWRRQFAGTQGLVTTVVARHLPGRLAERLLQESGVPDDRRSADLRRDERERLIARLTSFVLPWTGDEGYRKAEVTGGGVALDEVDPRTLESRRHPGLFLCGEMLDAFGPIGGHNFAFAWATGRLAGSGRGSLVDHVDADAVRPERGGPLGTGGGPAEHRER